MGNDNNIMGERIKELRTEKGLSQEQLGELVGLQKSAIAKYENGKTENMKRSIIEKMAKVFNVSPSYLMGFGVDNEHYIDEEAAELAQEVFDRPELRILFDASRDVSKEDILYVAQMLEKLKK